MDIQLVIVACVGVAVAVVIALKTRRFFTDKEKPSPCAGCQGCEISKTEGRKNEIKNSGRKK
ncbi:MAG: hypothetical protein LBS52_03840 [Dysgonamonadaceae bacterium]|jgi:hypothetical protein|nr:hypothetical protein [Dysgonamonadaceae bacterium]